MVVVACSGSKYGSKQNDRNIINVNEEIYQNERSLENLKDNLLCETDSSVIKSVKSEIEYLKNQIKFWMEKRDVLIRKYVLSDNVADELSNGELEMRMNSFKVKKQDFLLKKIANSFYDSTSTYRISDGLKVIIENERNTKVTFIFESSDGHKTSEVLNGKTKIYVGFVPDTYEITCIDNKGREIGHKTHMNIDGNVKYYEGEKCYGYVYMP